MGAAPTVAQAALNNALWCASVIRARGGAAHFAPTLWWSVQPAPPLYPRAVTLAAALDRGALQRLQRLAPGDRVKDSFACLPRSDYALLFAANWFWRPPGGGALLAERVATPAAFAAWVAAWGEGADILLPALLEDPSVAFLALRRRGAVVAGCVVSQGGGVAGLSNLFGEAAADRAAVVATAAALAGSLPLVDYEAPGEEATILQAGFRPLGPLRVLERQT